MKIPPIKKQILRYVIFPNSLPEILTGFIMGLLGLLFDITLRKIIDKTIPWHGKG